MIEQLNPVEVVHEYRRQNNIFEVGDWVVFVSEKMSFLDDNKIHLISMITENNLAKVCGLYVSFASIKHATDAEIEACRRLNLPESVVKSLGEVS